MDYIEQYLAHEQRVRVQKGLDSNGRKQKVFTALIDLHRLQVERKAANKNISKKERRLLQ